MAERCNHTIHKHHLGWNNANQPVLSIASGETIEFRTIDSSGQQITPSSTVADIARLDFGKVNPVSGPIFVEDAAPGDAIKVTLLDFTPSGWGWTANIGLRPARRSVQGAGASHLEVRSGEPEARRLRPGRARAAEALLRHHRPGASGAGPPQ